jgi:hypothetical protein
MFLSPIFASIPPYATGPAIVLVGALMMVSHGPSSCYKCIAFLCLVGASYTVRLVLLSAGAPHACVLGTCLLVESAFTPL